MVYCGDLYGLHIAIAPALDDICLEQLFCNDIAGIARWAFPIRLFLYADATNEYAAAFVTDVSGQLLVRFINYEGVLI